MIQLNKRPAPPVNLENQVVRDKLIELRGVIASGKKPKSTDFANYWYPKSREILWEHQNFKCCYCERLRELKRESDLEHFRPKAFVKEDVNHNGYWWLAYDFNNYLYSCKICNEDYKKNRFPLIDPDTRAYLETDAISDETPFLIDPYDENPEKLLAYFWESVKSKYIKIVSASDDEFKRAEKTAEIAGLNRITLMKERASFLVTLQGLVTIMNYAEQREGGEQMVKDTHDKILSETSSKKSFTGFRRYFFIHNGLGKYIADD